MKNNTFMLNVVYSVDRDLYPEKRFFTSEESSKAAFDAAVEGGRVERVTLYECDESMWGEMLPGRILYNFEPEFYGDEEIHNCVAEEAAAIEQGCDVWGQEEEEEDELKPDGEGLSFGGYTEEEIDTLCKEAETEAALHGPWDDESVPRHEALKQWAEAVRKKIESGEIDVDEIYVPERFWDEYAVRVRVLPVVDDVMFVPHLVALTICHYDREGQVYEWEDVEIEPLYVERFDWDDDCDPDEE